MSRKYLLTLLLAFLLISVLGAAPEQRVYRQIKDVSLDQSGKARVSQDKGDLFEITLKIDQAQKTVQMITAKRLDNRFERRRTKIYDIKKDKWERWLSKECGKNRAGVNMIMAVARDGDEIMQISDKFCFTSRVSPFERMISGVYKRVK